MLLNTEDLTGNSLLATDGEIGSIYDFYFDDQSWALRYVVADTGNWLPGRLVLLAPPAFGSYFAEKQLLCIRLLRQQIQDSPESDMHKPVSKQFEEEYFRYYGWPAFWNIDGMTASGAYPMFLPPNEDDLKSLAERKSHEDPHLRSTKHITGYGIQALDGEIGHVSGFLIQEHDWRIHEIVVKSGPWYSGKEVLISTACIKRISYEDSKIFVSLTKLEIEHTADRHIVKSEALA